MGGRKVKGTSCPRGPEAGEGSAHHGHVCLGGTPGLGTDSGQCLYKQRYSRIQRRKRYPGAKPVSPEAIDPDASRKLDARLDIPAFKQCIHIGGTQWLVRHEETEGHCVHWPAV